MLIKTYRLRLYVLYIVPLVFMAGLVVRLYFLQVVNHEFWKKEAKEQHFKEIGMIPLRGKVLDANGHDLAISVILEAAFIACKHLPKDKEKLATDLASDLSTALDLKYDDVYARLTGKLNSRPLLARNLDDKAKLAVRMILKKYEKDGVRSNLIEFMPENKRQYSRGELAPHVVGFTRTDSTGDNTGVAGVERTYNEILRGSEKKYRTRVSATQNPMEPADNALLESTFGHSVKLTINESLQEVTQDVLAQGVDKTRADSGVAVCYHVKTGEILALANYPTFDLTDIRSTTASQRRNRAVTDPIEPGSVMKIITFTSLFDDNLVQPSTPINCHGGSWTIPGINRLITDSHHDGVVPVSQVFQFSSNIGTIKAAQNFERAEFYEHITRFGFGSKTGVDLPEESAGVLRHYKKWDNWSMSSLPMGYEMQATPIQMVTAVGAIANKGAMMKPHVVKEIIDHNGNTVEKIEPEFVRSVASPEACRKIINLMELVVEKGTAKPAKLEGYRVGGKTGTTKKVGPNGYENAYIAGFCGVAPIEDPEVCIYVYIDNPDKNTGSFYGGAVAGPVFREIAREAMRVLRIPERRSVMPPDQFKQTLQKVRNEIEDRAPMEIVTGLGQSSDEVSSGTVPDLRRLSLAEAIKKAADAGLEVRVSGSGVVVAQDPKPYEIIYDNTVLNITLANNKQSIQREVNNYERLAELTEEFDESLAESEEAFEVTTSMSLKLTSEDGAVNVPVDLEPSAVWSPPQQREPASAADVVTYPDLDSYANQPVDPKAGRKSWEKYRKELQEMEKLERENEKKRQSRQDDAEEVVDATVPTDRFIPAIDGEGEIDPEKEVMAPVEIKTPERRKPQKIESNFVPYNL